MKYRYLTTLLIITLLTACLPVEEPVLPPPILTIPESAMYRTVPVFVGDVVSYREVNAAFVPAREEVLSFPMNGILIKEIFVREGDVVREGDIIAELERGPFIASLEQTENDINWARLDLRQLEEQHNLNLLEAEITGVHLDMSAYLTRRDNLIYQLDILEINKDYYEYEINRRVIRSPMDGVVISAVRHQEGDRTVADQRIASIGDQSLAVFIVRGQDADLVNYGDVFEVTIRRELYTGEVVDPEVFGIQRAEGENEAYIAIQGVGQHSFTSRDYGMFRVILDIREDVMYLPHNAIKSANARIFSYVYEDGLRVIKDIEVGLRGNNAVEILNGLEPGEQVIIE